MTVKHRYPWKVFVMGALDSCKQLSGKAKALYMFFYIDTIQGQSWSTVKQAMHCSGIGSVQTFYKALHELLKLKLISRQRETISRKYCECTGIVTRLLQDNTSVLAELDRAKESRVLFNSIW